PAGRAALARGGQFVGAEPLALGRLGRSGSGSARTTTGAAQTAGRGAARSRDALSGASRRWPAGNALARFARRPCRRARRRGRGRRPLAARTPPWALFSPAGG